MDAAILGSYLAGANSGRIRTALKPLLGERHLSKSTVSRIVARLKALFTTWQARDLRGERYAIRFLDGFYLKVRTARHVVAVPVLAVLGVTVKGQKQLVALQLAATEAVASRSDLLTNLQRRGLSSPLLVVTDGHAGLKKALENLNREFRRRTKTQASFGTEAAAITLLCGLVAFGQIVLRRIDGADQLPAFLAKEWPQAA